MEINIDDEDFRERVRQMLRGRAPGQFRFCDDSDSETHVQNPTEAPQLPPRVLSAVRGTNLIDYGRLASTEDHPDQGVEMTVKDDGNFWSSTGSPHDVGEEFLLYKLKHPFSVVRAVEVQVYRAAFQGGGPIYPAKQVLVEVGHSPSTMRTVGGPYTMACTDTPQMFLLPPSLENAAVGSFAAVRFRGKYQKQHFDDSFYLSMRYVRVLGSPCPSHDAHSMQRLISNPFPPPDVLGPASAPPSFAFSSDWVMGAPNPLSGSQQMAHVAHDTSTCVIELPKWAQRDIARSLYQMNHYSGRTGVRQRQVEEKKDQPERCDEGAAGRTSAWPSPGMSDHADSTANAHSLVTVVQTPNTTYCSNVSLPQAWGIRNEPGNNSAMHGLYSWQQPRRPASAGLLDRMLMRGIPRQCRQASSAGTPSCSIADSERYGLPPIEPLRTSDAETGMPSCRVLQSSKLQQGPLQHSVDEHGFLRCIIWERTTEASAGHLRCEGADDSEVEAPASAPRSHPQHAPLLLCNPVPSSVSDGIRLVGARKRAASTVGVGSPLKAARESNGKGGNTTVSDIHNLLYGQVQTVQFAVPLN